MNQPTDRALDVLLDSLPIMTWLTDTDLSVMWARGGAIRQLGLDCVVARGSRIPDMVGDAHPLVSAHQSALAGQTRSLDIEWTERSYQTLVQPLRDEQGSVIGCLGSAHDITELRQAERTILWQSAFDPLTGALNRNRFGERLDMILLQAKGLQRGVGLLVIDVDDFNPINSILGTVSGDEVLRALAKRITTSAPEDALIGRINGDEIAVVVSDASSADVHSLAEEIHRRLEEPFLAGEKEAYLSVSIGTAMFPFDGRTSEQLLRCARTAQRHAHQLGGHRSQVFFPALSIDSMQQMELDRGLRQALDRDEFFLVYQPQIRLTDGGVEGMEVLLRWRKDGDVLPAWSFIPRLEESQLMIPVGRWIIERAFGQLREWIAAGVDIGRLALNVGARQLSDESFVSHIRRVVSLHQIPPQLLDFEITETAAMQNVETSIRILEEVRELGAEITIDDFGTGYSSLNYLKRFTITGLKIDRSFVADLPSSRTGTAIVESMVATARALDLRLVAEGVENEDQAAWLRGAGCPTAQGFLFSKPIQADEVAGFIRARIAQVMQR